MDGSIGSTGLRGTQVAMILIAAAALLSAPLSGQYSATGSAMVVVPPVAQLDLESADPIQVRGLGDGTVEAEGSVVVRVRANHAWRVLVAAPRVPAEARAEGGPSGGAGTIAWRATLLDGGTGGEYQSLFQSLSPGVSAVAAGGSRGVAVIRIDYRWTAPSEEAAYGVPLTYTLASH